MAQMDTAPGHHWQESNRVAEYLERTDREQEERAVVFDLMTKLVPHSPDAAIKVLDVGSGHGVVAAAFLRAFPNSRAFGLDISEAMMEEGRRRMAEFGERFSYIPGDFDQGHLPQQVPDSGPYDVVVSARAIHHLPPSEIKVLYRNVYANVAKDGCFFNFDAAAPPDSFLDQRYRSLRRSRGEQRREETQVRRLEQGETHSADTTLLNHLEFLTAAGFTSVDCFYKNLRQAVVGGYKR